MFRTSTSSLAIISILSLTVPQSAFAQSESSQEITVIAPHVHVEEKESEDSGFAKVVVYEVRRQVSFADLDLTSEAGANEFKRRLNAAARDGCEEISKDYPLVNDKSCERVAISNATAQAQQVIDAAKSP